MLADLLQLPPADVFAHMACDEALARAQPDHFCLRFYRWQGPAATFGYAQRVREVMATLPPAVGTAYTRRPTGGGVVPHLHDLTFSCVFPSAGEMRAAVVYRRLHTAIGEGLRGMGLPVELCARGGSAAPHLAGGASQCFVQPVTMDIMLAGEKVLGGAIRRFGDTVLYQGSLQLADARAREVEYQAVVAEAIAKAGGLAGWELCPVPQAVRDAATALAVRYRSPEWIQRR